MALSLHIWFSQKFYLYIIAHHSVIFSPVRIDGAYKRISEKVETVDFNMFIDQSLMEMISVDEMFFKEKFLF